jgi:hypothetical protein
MDDYILNKINYTLENDKIKLEICTNNHLDNK